MPIVRDAPGTRGRPGATTHADIERAAFALFARDGFARTTLQAIATEVGVGRRTLFRYYASKNDIPWGQFGRSLEWFRSILDGMPTRVPVHESVHRGVIEFNRFPAEAGEHHRERMRLILATPELQAHSVLQYAAWRAVIADHVAARLGCRPGDPEPLLAGHVSLSLALTSYELWLATEDDDLLTILGDTMGRLRGFLSG